MTDYNLPTAIIPLGIMKYIKKSIKNFLLKFPPYKGLYMELNKYKTYHPPGHYYSPIPDIETIKKSEKRIFDRSKKGLAGINLNENQQIELLEKLSKYYEELPFKEEQIPELRYRYNNGTYCYSDAIFLYSMIRHLKPAQIIEVGSGFSSALMLDTNELFFYNQIDITFIEPFPVLFKKLIKEDDKQRFRLMETNLQDVDISVFKKLHANDILFIDSTHVAKTGSDVNYIFFEILPSLNPGVYIHFHDIFYPFEYPEEWIYKGFAWNEDYMLRTFLQYNNSFEIVMFNTFMEHFHEEWFAKEMPLCLKNKGGSIWIKKVI